jgi:hypothetical protein
LLSAWHMAHMFPLTQKAEQKALPAPTVLMNGISSAKRMHSSFQHCMLASCLIGYRTCAGVQFSWVWSPGTRALCCAVLSSGALTRCPRSWP